MEGATMLAPVTIQFATVQPERFGRRISELDRVEQQWTALATAQVENEQITPTQGLELISVVKAVLFGYNEFHRGLTASDVALLSGSAVSQFHD